MLTSAAMRDEEEDKNTETSVVRQEIQGSDCLFVSQHEPTAKD